MYHGRSVGRILQWLRRMCGRADNFQFGYEDGSVRDGGKVVITKIEWDKHDTPTFVFVDDAYNRVQKELGKEILLSECTVLQYRTRDDEIEELHALEKCPSVAHRIRMSDRPITLVKLLEKGLAKQSEEHRGWNDEGAMIQDVTIEITPQGRGFLEHLRDMESASGDKSCRR